MSIQGALGVKSFNFLAVLLQDDSPRLLEASFNFSRVFSTRQLLSTSFNMSHVIIAYFSHGQKSIRDIVHGTTAVLWRYVCSYTEKVEKLALPPPAGTEAGAEAEAGEQ